MLFHLPGLSIKRFFLWISVIHLLEAASNGWKNTFNLWGSQIIKLEALVYLEKLVYIFVTSKRTFHLHSLFSKQIINCQQTPLQQVSKMCLFRDHCEGSKFMFTVSGLFNSLFQHLLPNPRPTLSSYTEHRRSNQKRIFLLFYLFLKFSLCWQARFDTGYVFLAFSLSFDEGLHPCSE